MIKRITFSICLLFVGISLYAQGKVKHPAPKTVSVNSEVKQDPNTGVDGKIHLSTVHVKQEQQLSTSNETTTEVVSTGNMTGTPEKKTTGNKLTEETCRQLIDAMEKKMQWVKSNPEEDKKAKESGWYKQTKKELKKLKAQLKELGKIK